MLTNSPLRNRDWSFQAYLDRRLEQQKVHITGDDIPDYAYGLDYELRKKLDAVPGLRSLTSKAVGTWASQELQRVNRHAVCVSPTQFPDVYDAVCDCASRLGMAVPNVYIINDQSLNAGAYASDDIQPFIVVNSGMYERVTPGELKTVLGHECGHVQNNHITYNYIASVLASAGAVGIAKLIPGMANYLTLGVQAALSTWSRAAEVTSDRAGMICADSIEDCYTAEAKFMYGATFREQKIDFEGLKEQLDMQMQAANFSRFDELFDSHPSTVRRIMAMREFAECEVLYGWRPELRKAETILRGKEECDTRCKAYVDLSSSKRVR